MDIRRSCTSRRSSEAGSLPIAMLNCINDIILKLLCFVKLFKDLQTEILGILKCRGSLPVVRVDLFPDQRRSRLAMISTAQISVTEKAHLIDTRISIDICCL